ncbi:MAG TPA: hypothetical protein VGF29_14120 [Hyphomicrobiaceae bacterium]|jgi:hypothetical protein
MRPPSHAFGDRSDTVREHRPARLGAALTTSGNDASGGEPRSSYGTVPGAEFPAFVYLSVLAAFAWIMLASWLAFAADMDAALSLGFAVVLGVVLFSLPIIMREVAAANARKKRETTGDFLSAPVETATGPLRGSSAWLQVLIIPLALALAATLIGAAFILAR